MKTFKPLNVLALLILVSVLSIGCKNQESNEVNKESKTRTEVNAEDILGNPEYLAISYGGYRKMSRDSQPTIKELKDDMMILSAMGIKILRTYNVQLKQAPNLLKAISELKQADPSLEMYVMLGAWIDCENAWTGKTPNHNKESEANAAEIERAVALAKRYPEIVKVIAVGNEAMVKWAASYYVQPDVILKWVTYLQEKKASGELPEKLWITSSDDFASWGGGDPLYHTDDLEKLYHAVDYVSMHTYPYHNSHYNPEFWQVPLEEENLDDIQKVDAAMQRAVEFAKAQYNSVSNYMKSIGVDKPIHIGETGWATTSNGFYGPKGSKATDQYKQAKYHSMIRDWTNENNISCFYFEAFNERWKDAANQKGSENHFGLFTIDGQAKYALWELVDAGLFDGLTRNGNPITKTHDGNKELLMKNVLVPPSKNETTIN
ncbi:glycosyl hydrolase family 17 protein [Salinimicrobium gaetbulicola]|uniref:Endo-1,3-beta-glucanase btgC n=1 Tax=Salinimicrobium gaetbulicola TaxID=999702 RepID=A0ABW3IGD4_9FLAO